MNIFLEEEEIEIITPLPPSEDKGVVITPQTGKSKRENVPELVKEITAMDAMQIGPVAAGIINGVAHNSASKYSSGQDMEKNPDVKLRVQQARYGIQDVATTLLMDTLGMLNPAEITKPRDQIAVATGLASILDKMDDKGQQGTKVELHLYAPTQRTEKEYKVIDV